MHWRRIGLALALLVLVVAPARAQLIISSDTTIDFAIPGPDPGEPDIPGDVTVVGSAVLTLKAGAKIRVVSAQDNSQVEMFGGSIGDLDTLGTSRAEVSGGVVRSDVHARGNSTVSFSGGVIGTPLSGDLEAYDNSTVSFSGGTIFGFLQAYGNSHVTVSGGAIDIIEANESSLVTVTGGTIGVRLVVGDALKASSSGTLQVFGCVSLNNGNLTGTLQDGTPIDVTVSETGSGQIVLKNAQPPSIQNASVTPNRLWPPNHKMVLVTVGYSVVDDCGPTSTVLSVSSNEPVNGLGDGDTAPDWQVVDAHHVLLRAERSDTGNGRIYAVTITATDSHGNVSTEAATVTVPHGAP